MNRNIKYILLLVSLIFIINRGYLIIKEFSESRIIEVRKEIYDNDEKDYLKGYEITNAPFEQFDIVVAPKSFWDYLLLTNKDGNFLSLILQLASSCCLFLYISMLDFNNITWQRGRLLFIAGYLIAFAFLAIDFGLDHTKTFWESIYSYHRKTNFWKYAFYVETKNNMLIYLYASLVVLGAFKNIMWYYRTPKVTNEEIEPIID